MRTVHVISRNETASVALRLALSSFPGIEAVDAGGATAGTGERGLSLVLDCGWERDDHGDLRDFYRLRRFLWGPGGTALGPIAVIGIADWLFASRDQQVPRAELVRYFAVPFEIEDLAAFLNTAEAPANRQMTRLFLRGKLTDGDLAALARGDKHGIRHFSTLMLRIEDALASNRPAMLCSKQDLHTADYMGQVWAAEAMVACARTRPVGAAFRTEANECLSSLAEVIQYFGALAKLIDSVAAADGAVHAEPSQVLEEVRRLANPSVRDMHESWCRNWARLARRLWNECVRQAGERGKPLARCERNDLKGDRDGCQTVDLCRG